MSLISFLNWPSQLLVLVMYIFCQFVNLIEEKIKSKIIIDINGWHQDTVTC